MATLMTLNQNGQGITLSNQLREEKKVVDGASLKKLISAEPREYTFAQTFPTGTHAMWLYYWLASIGVNPFKDVKTIVVPPPQMVANMRIGNMDGYCVGEPWNARAVADKIGFTVATTTCQPACVSMAMASRLRGSGTHSMLFLTKSSRSWLMTPSRSRMTSFMHSIQKKPPGQHTARRCQRAGRKGAKRAWVIPPARKYPPPG